MNLGRTIFGICVIAFAACTARAETYSLVEAPREGACFRIKTETQLAGTLTVTREGKSAPLKIVAKNEHAFVERIIAADRLVAKKTVRHYQSAVSHATVDGEKADRELARDRRLIVAQRAGDLLLCYSPTSPLTRSDLEVVSEHFETLHLTGLLPNKDVAIGDSWKLESITAQSLCLFDGLVSHELVARLKEVNAGVAVIAIEGTAKGIENGALANLAIAATVRFDLTRKQIANVEWKQKDVRDQGPVSPAADLEIMSTLTREPVETAPTELSDAIVTGLPQTDEPAATLRHLVHRDGKGRYQFLHSRDWHVVGQTDYHLVLRLLDRGDFVAQATVTPWTNAGAGKHISPEDFEKLTAGGSNWKMEQVTDRTSVPTDADRWAYRVSAQGMLDGNQVVQNFYVMANANGDQIVVTFTMRPASVARLGTRDLELLNAIDFLKK
ncbi:MAG TPA: hypothetical protein VHR66_08410 [Gemmataceae bacterium]|jgi:hypothetical protein|nr:hypothetical protein [Gemmataceae bacterium]